jgi:hypothetical protein
VGADPGHIVDHALVAVGDGKPVDVGRFCGAWPLTEIGESVRAERGGLEAVRQQPAHDLVGEALHPAVGVVDHEPLLGTQQLVGDDQ